MRLIARLAAWFKSLNDEDLVGCATCGGVLPYRLAVDRPGDWLAVHRACLSRNGERGEDG